MNKQEYLDLRNGLYAEAETLINEGKVDEANTKIEEIKTLDNKFEDEAKAQANLNALKDSSKLVNGVASGFNGNQAGVIDSIGASNEEEITNSLEYRKAFMNYVAKGEAISKNFKNVSEITKTTDIGELIPETVLSRIIEKVEATGMILPLVTRTAFRGGLTIPTSQVKPVATWVTEGSGSDKQKKSTGSITFAYHKLRCAIANTLEVGTMALPVFEATFINNVTEAMVKALEQAIVSGTGVNQPKGFLTEAVEAEKTINIAKADKPSLQQLEDAEAALPLAYENGAVWFMTKKTFMAYASIKDSTGQPVGRVNYGIGGKAERMLLGRPVVLNDYMKNYVQAATEEATVIALFNPSDYILNTNLNMTIKRYEDNETDDEVTKAIMLADGKVADKESLIKIVKKNA